MTYSWRIDGRSSIGPITGQRDPVAAGCVTDQADDHGSRGPSAPRSARRSRWPTGPVPTTRTCRRLRPRRRRTRMTPRISERVTQGHHGLDRDDREQDRAADGVDLEQEQGGQGDEAEEHGRADDPDDLALHVPVDPRLVHPLRCRGRRPTPASTGSRTGRAPGRRRQMPGQVGSIATRISESRARTNIATRASPTIISSRMDRPWRRIIGHAPTYGDRRWDGDERRRSDAEMRLSRCIPRISRSPARTPPTSSAPSPRARNPGRIPSLPSDGEGTTGRRTGVPAGPPQTAPRRDFRCPDAPRVTPDGPAVSPYPRWSRPGRAMAAIAISAPVARGC